MRSILDGITQSEPGAKFYLAGNTALALRLGHRLSVALDFFSPTEDIPILRPAHEKAMPVCVVFIWHGYAFAGRPPAR